MQTMQSGLRGRLIATVTATIAALLCTPGPALRGQTTEYRAPRTADGRPDLNGIWQALNTANYDVQAHAARPALSLVPAPSPADHVTNRATLPIPDLQHRQ